MKLFVSRLVGDRAEASEIVRHLEGHDFEVWSRDSVCPGESITEAVLEAEERADAFLILLSHGSTEDPSQALELGAALSSAKPIIPVLIAPDARVPAVLRDRPGFDLTEPEVRSKRIDELAETTRNLSRRSLVVADEGLLDRPAERDELDPFISARVALELDRRADARSKRDALRRQLRLQSATATVALMASLTAIATSFLAQSGSNLLTAIAAGLLTAFAALLGLSLGRREEKAQ